MPQISKKVVHNFKTFAEAVKFYGGEANALEALSTWATRRANEKAKNKDGRELLKVAMELLKEGKITLPAKS